MILMSIEKIEKNIESESAFGSLLFLSETGGLSIKDVGNIEGGQN